MAAQGGPRGGAPRGGRLTPTAPSAFLAWLDAHKKAIAAEWVERLAGASERYARRPLSELRYTVFGAFRAYRQALDSGSPQGIEQFIAYITRKRLKTGFTLTDVQNAFELFRTIVLERLLQPDQRHLLPGALAPLNACLTYTIQGFSDRFQRQHDQLVSNHARELEQQVRQRTAELVDERLRYKTLVEQISDGVFLIQRGRVRFANPAFCRMHGLSWEQAVNQPFLRFVAPASRPLVREAYRRALAGEKALDHLEYDRQGCPPERVATEMRARLVDLGQGRAALGICRDISQSLVTEAKAREHERLAYLGQLTASLSHEIRNPLSAIKLNLQILSRRLELDGFDNRRLEITAREVTRLEQIMRQMLDTARPLSLEPTPVDLGSLAQGCLEVLEPRLHENGIQVGLRLSRDLPLARGDAASLQQAMQNLLLNALEASPPGGLITVFARKSREAADNYLELGVRDHGAGVAPADLPLLFKPFFTRKRLGTGLGLVNVKRVAEAHGGRVVVRNRPGQGASFAMRLPCPS